MDGTYTLEERREFYVKMIALFESLIKGRYLGFCGIIHWVALNDERYVHISHLPELMTYKPTKNDRYDVAYWFPLEDKQKRIDILTKIVKDIDICLQKDKED